MALARILALASLLLTGCLALVSKADLWPCQDDSDCEDGERCLPVDSSTLRCQVPITPECNEQILCPTGSHCANNRCEKGECGALVPCPAGSHCAHGLCEKNECEQTDDPGCNGYACDTGTFTCRTKCARSDDCQQDYLCREGQCVFSRCSPSTPGTCGAYACENEHCRTKCFNSGHCAMGYACTDGVCKDSNLGDFLQQRAAAPKAHAQAPAEACVPDFSGGHWRWRGLFSTDRCPTAGTPGGGQISPPERSKLPCPRLLA